MGLKSRRKGAGYEREVCGDIFDVLGIAVTRKLGQARDSGNDVDLPKAGGGAFRLECKRRARIAELRAWMDQVAASCGELDTPAVVLRADGWPSSFVLLELSDFLSLIREELDVST